MDKQAEIAECAYYIWQRKGCPEGTALECWLEAEAELAAAAQAQDQPAALVMVDPHPAVREHRKAGPKSAVVHHPYHRNAA